MNDEVEINDDITFQNILDAANNLVNAIDTTYNMEAVNIWTDQDGDDKHFDSFLTNYNAYRNIQANRGFGIPFDQSAEAYIKVKDELASLNTLANFMQKYFTPYLNLMNDYSYLTSNASINYFKNNFLADRLEVGSFSDLCKTLQAFADIDLPCPDISSTYTAIHSLIEFAPWTPSNPWRIALSNVSKNLAKASTSDELGINNGVTIDDIIDAAEALIVDLDTDNLGFIKDYLRGQYNSAYYLSDFQQYGNETSTCNNPTPSQSDRYAVIFPITHVLVGIVGFLNDYFMPYYNLILNNQNLLSEESLEWWNYNFNSAIYSATFDEGTYYTSFISMLRGLQQYNHLDGSCPYAISYVDYKANYLIFYKQVTILWNLFKEWPGSPIRNTLSDIREKISAKEDSSLDSALGDFQTISECAKALSLAVVDSSLQVINNVTGLCINDFVGYFSIFAKDARTTNIAYYSISDVLNALATFAKIEQYVVALDTAIQANPKAISATSLSWYTNTFRGKNLVANSSVSISIIDFLSILTKFALTGGISSIKEGDDTWNMLLVLYNFTPWNENNTIYNAMLSCVDQITSA
jgi:hypothetical protein